MLHVMDILDRINSTDARCYFLGIRMFRRPFQQDVNRFSRTSDRANQDNQTNNAAQNWINLNN